MQVELTKDCTGFDPDKPGKAIKRPKGTIIDHPRAGTLLRTGMARPVDDEAKAKAKLIREDLESMRGAKNEDAARAATKKIAELQNSWKDGKLS